MNGKELEIVNANIMWDKEADKHKETLSAYDNNGEENILSTSEKKEKAGDGYVFMYECGKHLFCSMY